jgi:hypothetical protein
MEEVKSPRILKLSWGRLEVEGQDKPYKDAVLYPGGSRPWDWGETGTRHSPGIQPADVAQLLDHGAQVVVLSKGYFGRLGVCEETLAMLEQRGIGVHALRTEKAVELYNQLCESEPVGALIHSTC